LLKIIPLEQNMHQLLKYDIAKKLYTAKQCKQLKFIACIFTNISPVWGNL